MLNERIIRGSSLVHKNRIVIAKNRIVIARNEAICISLADCFVPTNEQRSKRHQNYEFRCLWARPFIDSFIKPRGLLVSRNDDAVLMSRY